MYRYTTSSCSVTVLQIDQSHHRGVKTLVQNCTIALKGIIALQRKLCLVVVMYGFKVSILQWTISNIELFNSQAFQEEQNP